MKIKIVVDSSCDYSKEEAEELGIKVLPMKITFGNDTYLDGVDLTKEQFFDKLIENAELPRTSQIPPNDYIAAFEEALEEYDAVLCLTISSKVSGSYNNARLAAEEFAEKVFVVDTLNVTVGEQLLIQKALDLVKEGKDIVEIVDILNDYAKRVRLIALLGTLDNLKKGGRISNVTALIGNFLNIKPVISITDGKVKIEGKARGSLNGQNHLREYIKKNGGMDDKENIYFAYSVGGERILEKYIMDNNDLCSYDLSNNKRTCIGAAIGTHIGIGAICVAYFVKNK